MFGYSLLNIHVCVCVCVSVNVCLSRYMQVDKISTVFWTLYVHVDTVFHAKY